MMEVEILFSDLTYYYGDYGNVAYLLRCLKDASFTFTGNKEVPAFVNRKVDLVYLGSLSENKQLIAIERLNKYRDILKKRIEEGVFFLFTGNAMEILGQYIETESKEKIQCLSLYDFYTKRDLNKRHNYLFLGEYEDLIIVGNKSQYSLCYGDFTKPFIKVNKGVGNNPQDHFEGIHDHNLFATYLLGPFLVLNPLFTEKLIRKIDPNSELAYREEIIQAYNRRVEEMNNPKLIYTLHEH